MRAAIRWMKKINVAKIVVAVPVAPPDTLGLIKKEVDEVVCLYSTQNFMSVGRFYEELPQIEDEEVIKLLWK